MARGRKSKDNGLGGRVDREALNRYVSRIEAIEVERSSLSEDVKEIYGEAKSAGFSVPILRQIVRERRMEETARHDQYAILDAYRAALGMLAGTPLGDAAMERGEEADGPEREAANPRSGRLRSAGNGETEPEPEPEADPLEDPFALGRAARRVVLRRRLRAIAD